MKKKPVKRGSGAAKGLAALKKSVAGEVLTAESKGYDEARNVFNVGARQKPELIVRAKTAADVQAAVRYARGEGLPLSVRGGGHGAAGHAVVPKGLEVDLSLMRKVAAGAKTAKLGGGCRGIEVLQQLSPKGKAAVSGFDKRLGISGFSLGGGYGMLSRLRGLGCDNLVSAEVVTAEGKRVTASAKENPELLWALRGAGANFGVVTSMEVRLFEAPVISQTIAMYDVRQTRQVLRDYRDFAAGLPESTTLYFAVDLVQAEPRTPMALLYGFHLGDPEEGERRLAPVAKMGQPLNVMRHRFSYADAHHEPGGKFAEGLHHRWRSRFVEKVDDEVVDALSEIAPRSLEQDLYLVVEHLGGATSRPDAGHAAWPHRKAGFGVVMTLDWKPGKEPSSLFPLQEQLYQRLRPGSVGTYVSYLPRDYNEDDVRAAYGASLPKLRELKKVWDPGNFFSSNVNITPD